LDVTFMQKKKERKKIVLKFQHTYLPILTSRQISTSLSVQAKRK
jgi:hypothetical protein